MEHTTTHKQKWLFFLKASIDPKTINIDIGGTGVMCFKAKTYDEMAVFFEEPGIKDVGKWPNKTQLEQGAWIGEFPISSSFLVESLKRLS